MSDGHKIAMALRSAYLALHRRSDAQFARYRLTADQFVLLSALAVGDTVTQRELARRTSSDPNSVRAMLLLLEKQGLVARGAHPTDGRARTVALTPKGLRAYQKLWALGEPVRAKLLAALGPGEPAVLLDLLARVTRAMAPTTERGPRVNGATTSSQPDEEH
jgi:DNA-binding MarR family transcriptional regulator